MTQSIKLQDIQVIVLAGGSGTRLWPLSRRSLPKQFVQLLGDETLLEATVARLFPFIGSEKVTIVTSRASAAGEAMVYLAPYAKLLEPCPRGTAPAIAIAALSFVLQGRDPILIVLPSDHLIRNAGEFQARLADAVSLAASTEVGNMITFGVTPTKPESGYGYIKTTGGLGANKDRVSVDVQSFTEKPDLDTAIRFIAEGGYYWNSGMFVWRASIILAAIRCFLPMLDKILDDIRFDVSQGKTFEMAVDRHFAGAPSISIDKGVLEKLTDSQQPNANTPTQVLRLQLVPADIGWSDVGSWDAVYEISDKDGNQNVTVGNTLIVNTKNTLVHGGKRLITTVGVEDLNIIDTPDALLITKRGESQQVRNIVDALQTRGTSEHIEHLTVQRPWGSYTVLEDAPNFKIKRIEVKPGGRLSLQSHVHRSEHWVVVNGKATITCGETVSELSANESIYVAANEKHRLENMGSEPVTIIEVQLGAYLGEDDIKRYEDIYGRAVD